MDFQIWDEPYNPVALEIHHESDLTIQMPFAILKKRLDASQGNLVRGKELERCPRGLWSWS